ncbi:HlyD family efflux transporter periplasmic adaptor subunit [Phyllobacterium sp. SB3]|uniref:HlyD family efflux transporter periplasmic adaptor subunit n=1 Tax=Phyllobacterium sp. SB3 TaxID=3156073 RepID=UPI0032AFB3F0
MNRRAVIAVLALAPLGAVAGATYHYGWWGGRHDTGLTLSGNVDIRQVDLGFRVDGRIAEIPFDEGAHVSAGDILARLDAAPYEASAAAARAQVTVAQTELDKQRNGNRAQDIAQAQARLDQEQATLARTRTDFDRYAALVRTGAVSRAGYDQARESFQTAQGRVAAAAQALSLQQEGARREDIDTAAAQLALAGAQNDKAATDLADTVLNAPNAGTILTRAREPGATVQSGDIVLTLTIDRPMRVRAYIDEPELHRITPGMPVLVTTDGNARTYHGTIGFISPTAEFTPKTVQTTALRATLVYRLRIIIEDPDDGLRQGAPVSVVVPDPRSTVN